MPRNSASVSTKTACLRRFGKFSRLIKGLALASAVFSSQLITASHSFAVPFDIPSVDGSIVEVSGNEIQSQPQAPTRASTAVNRTSAQSPKDDTQSKPLVRFHAWGGSAQVNGYLQWVAAQVSQRFNIELQHVKLADTSDAVSRVLAEKAAGNHDNGSVDLIWINGENFAAMKKHDLLAKDWVKELDHFALTRPEKNSAMVTDFGEPTLGMEAPWGKASMVFYYRSAHMKALGTAPPQTINELLRFSQKAPGRFTYPVPSDYLGISFIKYAAIALNGDKQSLFYQPVTESSLQAVLPALWAYLDQLHPTMWQQGKYMLRQASQLQRLVGTGELTLAFSFTAAEIPSAVNRFDLPDDVRTYAMQDGSLANVHFVGLTYNSKNKTAAKTVVNFLLSPEA
ncbi:MAG TPA: ABC transporter substrate-binding protein, partial [Alteromonas macleodii]|nr:ABC transporter substrate-binding protein [Alteromonas macleodii]